MILVDTHVHVHPCFDLPEFLDAASGNLHVSDPASDTTCRVLCLTEASGRHVFKDWAKRPGQAIAGPWRVADVANDVMIRLTHDHSGELWIVAGRQIVSSERLEILCLGHDSSLPDGTVSLSDLAARIREAGGLPVIPWGFGKWIGRRGRIVNAFLEKEAAGDAFCLGDNGNRPRAWPEPAAFARARARDIAVLPGSDPLPLRCAGRDAGRYGLQLDGSLSHENLWPQLRARLARPDTSCIPHGRRETWPRFLVNQTLLRLPH